ncbi:hypothetical protein ABTB51_20355, partial [Acinetobacter baumannii]
ADDEADDRCRDGVQCDWSTVVVSYDLDDDRGRSGGRGRGRSRYDDDEDDDRGRSGGRGRVGSTRFEYE